jgi:hypothetical protein
MHANQIKPTGFQYGMMGAKLEVTVEAASCDHFGPDQK